MDAARTRTIAFTTMILGGLCQGASYNIAKEAGLAGLPPISFLFWSLVGATAWLLLLAIATRSLPPLTLRTAEYFAASGLLTVTGGWVINVLAAPIVGAGFISLTVAIIPLLTYAAATAIGIDRATLKRSAGVALALCGGIILAWNRLSVPDAPVFWILLALCMPLFLSAGNIYRTIRWPRGLGPVELTLGMVAGGLIWSILTAWVSGQSLAFPEGAGAASLIALQAIALGGQFLALLVLLKHAGIVFQSMMAVTAALFGVVIAIAVLGEAAPKVLLPSAGLILVGVLLTGIRRNP